MSFKRPRKLYSIGADKKQKQRFVIQKFVKSGVHKSRNSTITNTSFRPGRPRKNVVNPFLHFDFIFLF